MLFFGLGKVSPSFCGVGKHLRAITQAPSIRRKRLASSPRGACSQASVDFTAHFSTFHK